LNINAIIKINFATCVISPQHHSLTDLIKVHIWHF